MPWNAHACTFWCDRQLSISPLSSFRFPLSLFWWKEKSPWNLYICYSPPLMFLIGCLCRVGSREPPTLRVSSLYDTKWLILSPSKHLQIGWYSWTLIFKYIYINNSPIIPIGRWISCVHSASTLHICKSPNVTHVALLASFMILDLQDHLSAHYIYNTVVYERASDVGIIFHI